MAAAWLGPGSSGMMLARCSHAAHSRQLVAHSRQQTGHRQMAATAVHQAAQQAVIGA